MDNKTYIDEKAKQSYIGNKEQIVMKRMSHVICECGGCYIHCNKSRHEKCKNI